MDNKIREQVKVLFDAVVKIRKHVIDKLDQSEQASESPCSCMTHPQMHMMMKIRDCGQMTVKEVAEAMGVSAPSASAMIDRLVDMDAVMREHSKEDRREVIVRISPKGIGLVSHVEDGLLNTFGELLEKLGPEDAHKWCQIYEKILVLIDEDNKRD